MYILATDLDPLLPASTELAFSVVAASTLAFCVFVMVQVGSKRWTARLGVSFILMAVILPVVGPLLGFWLMHRSRPRAVATPQ